MSYLFVGFFIKISSQIVCLTLYCQSLFIYGITLNYKNRFNILSQTFFATHENICQKLIKSFRQFERVQAEKKNEKLSDFIRLNRSRY